MKNLQRYKKSLQELIDKGMELYAAALCEFSSEECPKHMQGYIEEMGWNNPSRQDEIPSFVEEYQLWYSEALAVVCQLLPERQEDFLDYYQEPEARKAITCNNYRISDYLAGREIGSVMGEDTSSLSANIVISSFQQQLAIVKAVPRRLESSLYDIKQLVQADLFDSELEAAEGIMNNGFLHAAGMMAAVVMEKHLAQVCEKHGIEFKKEKRKLTINDFNKSLKDNNVIDTPEWRRNQYLGDLRNLCSHYNEGKEVTKEKVEELIKGVERAIRMIS